MPSTTPSTTTSSKHLPFTIRRYQPSDHEQVRILFRQGMESLMGDAALATIQAPALAVPTLLWSSTVAVLVSRRSTFRPWFYTVCSGLVAASIPVAIGCYLTIQGFSSWIQHVLEQEDMKSPEHLQIRFGGNGVFLVAEDDATGTLLGMVAAESTPQDGVFELRRMSVQAQAQKRGIGKQLIRRLEHELGPTKQQIYLTCSSVQYAAHRLYETMGFIKTKTQNYGKWQGIRFFRYEKNY
ncbi:hypothetical protein FisN_24Lh122 [Fistulifera solaris]|uniref:N-acetyltransferase domain-containing protein n=1 Tax=Fistulifera solaris TaxID=1519565 RepID=A0A1Z5K987_FISSO|nr:hypothetical protein FisN_24Lh122 [Fistulifera solaris]|eukprot:GAX22839.1 hypothetical protein FisN_24Lh122 [Fistulifera solaris]